MTAAEVEPPPNGNAKMVAGGDSQQLWSSNNLFSFIVTADRLSIVRLPSIEWRSWHHTCLYSLSNVLLLGSIRSVFLCFGFSSSLQVHSRVHPLVILINCLGI